MSFEEEWAADKAAVTMKLDQADSTGGSTPPSGSADYVVEDDDLGEIGHAAHGLFDGLEPAGKHANAASEGAGSSLKGDGFDAGAALSEVNKTWETQVKTLLQACAHISNHLDFASDVHQILGKNMDGHTTFNDLDIDRGDLTRVIRGVAEDPKAFGVIHHSQSVVIADGLNSFPEDSNRRQDPQLRAWVKQSASVLGHLDGVRGDVIYDLGQAQRDANGENQMYAMMREMAMKKGLQANELDRSPGEYEDGLQPTAEQWYQAGIKDADLKMGER
ncbi:hypothetical protein [Streptomyces sp. NBC_00069]|uniref:hypothetical protein n=1 Tax=Streptomyces sp. NBC_00069 TaxID=2975639 RepID=UPI002F915485